MEFEQDMYDDLQGDEDALRGLRKHSKEGLGRYADPMPLHEKKNFLSDFVNWMHPDSQFSEMLGSYMPEGGHRKGPDNDPDLIDINMLKLLSEEDDLNAMVEGTMLDDEELVPGSLQDKISDIYRHEYKHAAGLGHPEIYKQWYKNLDPSFMIGDYYQDYNKGGIVSLVR